MRVLILSRNLFEIFAHTVLPLLIRTWPVPARGQGAGLGLAVAHHGQGDQVRVVVDRPVCVRDAVAQLAALVDAAGCLGRGVAADPARE
jgi:hypothetical protein